LLYLSLLAIILILSRAGTEARAPSASPTPVMARVHHV